MTLPGIYYVNGVSAYIFGSSIGEDFATHTTRNTPQLQSLAKSAGITIMRCAIPAGSKDSVIDQTASACAAIGADMLVILSYKGGLTWNQHLVSYLGNRCLLYEFSNEPDIASPSISWQSYLSAWNNTIPKLRAINGGAAFIGPALGVFSNRDSYLKPWLQGCVASGVLPDGISFHIYPCTGMGSSATCNTKSGGFASSATTMNALVTSVVGHTLPLCLTEWNIDANDNPQSYTQDASFVEPWYASALDSMVSGGYAIANQFTFASGSANGKLDLVNCSTFKPRPGYATLVTKTAQYLGGLAGGGGGTGVVDNPTTFYFSSAAASTVATADQLYTAPGTPSTTWTYTKLGTATGWGEITSQGTTSAWAAAGSIGSPTGKGFLFDSTSLEGKQIKAGAISAKVRLNCGINDGDPNHGSITADIVVRLSKRSSGGSYTTIITLTATGQTVPAGYTTFSLSGTLADPVSFDTGDKLSIEVWSNVLTNTNGLSTLNIRLNRLSLDTAGKTGDANASLTVASIQTVGGTTALSLFLANATSGVLSTAEQLYTTSGAPATTAHYSRVGTATGWGEICSQTTTAAWAALGAIGSPTGKGFFLDASTLDNKQLLAGNWGANVRLNAAQSGDTHPQQGTLTADIVRRIFKFRPDGSVYTPIVTFTKTGQTIDLNFTTFAMPSSAGVNIAFSPGDKLYIDHWAKVLTNANGASDQDIRLNRLSTDTTTFLGDTTTQTVSPGYTAITDSGGGGGITQSDLQVTIGALKLFRDHLLSLVKFVALGSSAADLTPNDSKLGNEIFRKAVSSVTPGANPGELLISLYLAPGDALGKSISEVGFFGGPTATSAANTGTMFARGLFSHSNKNNLESFVFQVDFSFLLG
jgi:hypothetical protein